MSIAKSKQPVTFFATIEDRYGNISTTQSFATKQALVEDMTVELGEDGNGYDNLEFDRDDVERLVIKVYEVNNVTIFDASNAGIKLTECK